MNKIISCLLLWAVAFCLGAGEKITFTNAAQFRGNVKNLNFNKNVITVKGRAHLLSKRSFDVKEGKVYYVNGFFRQVSGSKNAKIVFGFQGYDKKNRPITVTQISAVKGTDTVLMADVPRGAESLVVKDASKWLKGRAVVFNTRPDRSDLPNFNRIPARVISITKQNNGTYLVKFRGKVRTAMKKGTHLRQHRMGGTIYACPGAELRNYFWEISGRAAKGTKGYINLAFYPGTVKTSLVAVISADKDSVVEIKDLTFEAE